MRSLLQCPLTTYLTPLGGVSHLVVLNLPEALAHHKDAPILLAEEQPRLLDIQKFLEERGFLDLSSLATILGRPVFSYVKISDSFYLAPADNESDVYVEMESKELFELLRNLANSEASESYGDLQCYDLLPSSGYVACDLQAEGWRIGMPSENLNEVAGSIYKILTSDAFDLLTAVKKVASELDSMVFLLNPGEHKIALVPGRDDWFIPIEYKHLMDLASIYG